MDIWPGMELLDHMLILEVNIDINPHELRYGNGFLDVILKVYATKEKVDKLNII